MLTFVDQPAVSPTNNHAERQIRPAVLMRKASFGNACTDGAATRAVLMSINRTFKQRGLDPLEVTTKALRTYATTGQLPPLPTKPTDDSS